MARGNGSATRQGGGNNADDDDDDDEDRLERIRVTDRDRKGRQRPDITDLVSRVVQQNNGDPQATNIALLQQNFDLRDERRELHEQLDTLERRLRKRGEAPPKGSVILSAEEAKTWEAFKALNVKPEDVTGLQTRAAKADAREAEEAATVVAARAAELAEPGTPWNAKLLARGIRDDKLHLELRSVDQKRTDGQEGTVKVEVPYVRPLSDDKAALQPLAEYATARWGDDLLPALRTPGSGNGGTGEPTPTTNGGQGGAPGVVRFPVQSRASGRAPSATDTTGQVLAKKYAGPPKRNTQQGAAE